MVNVKAVDNALEFLALKNFSRINAHQVAYLAGENDVNAVYEYLISKQPWVLKRYFEIMCPNFHSAASYERLEDIPKRWIECRGCHEDAEFIPDLDRIHIVFDFSPEYLAQLKKEQESEKKLMRPMVMA